MMGAVSPPQDCPPPRAAQPWPPAGGSLAGWMPTDKQQFSGPQSPPGQCSALLAAQLPWLCPELWVWVIEFHFSLSLQVGSGSWPGVSTGLRPEGHPQHPPALQ